MVYQEQCCIRWITRCCTGYQFLCALASKEACLVIWWTRLQLFLSLLFGTVFIWGSDLLDSMDRLLQPTLSWVSGSAHPGDPVCLRQLPWLPVICFALGLEECRIKWCKEFRAKHFPARPKHPILSKTAWSAWLPCSDVDLMVWSGTTYSSGYGEVAFEIRCFSERCLVRKSAE